MIFPFRSLVFRAPRAAVAPVAAPRRRALLLTAAGFLALGGLTTAALLGPARPGRGQTTGGSIALPWSGYGHDPQHTGISYTPATATLGRVKWQTPVDLAPQYTGTSLLAHYGSPLVTAGNTVIVPVKTGPADGFKVEGRRASDGTLLWTLPTDYALPPHNWVPTFGMTLTPKNRLVAPGPGGTLVFRDTPDAAAGTTGRLAFYGLANHDADAVTYDANIRINTPITCDRYGSLYFGFQVLGTTPLNLQSGIARIGYNGVGSWVAASALADGDTRIAKVVTNCAPALGNDQRTLYVAVNSGNGSGQGANGYLVALSSQTLARTGIVHLMDPRDPASREALILDDGSGAPCVGPDGDVYYGVWGDNGYRGFLLHFNAALTQTKTPAAFGWDITPSQIPARCVPSYTGTSSYLLLIKYNDYVEGGGDGVNKLAIVDPNVSAPDPRTGVATMKEVLTIASPTPDDTSHRDAAHPDAVREWCINTAAIDTANKCALVNNEDGKLYRWDFTTNTLSQSVTLTGGLGEAYTPTIIGVDGTVYAINDATLFAVGP